MDERMLDLIKSRRSVRAYSPEPVERDVLMQLVECASWAPSASNIQPWCFGVVDAPKMLRDIQMFAPGLQGNPPAIIVMCVDTRRALQRAGKAGPNILARMDVALAAENLMLAAQAFGLGSCIVRSFNISAVTALLNLPEHMRIETLISVGRPAKAPGKGKRRPIEEVTFYNEWEGN